MPNRKEREGNRYAKEHDLGESENSRSAQQHSMHDEEEKSGYPKGV
jgi:hypothetical protein